MFSEGYSPSDWDKKAHGRVRLHEQPFFRDSLDKLIASPITVAIYNSLHFLYVKLVNETF